MVAVAKWLNAQARKAWIRGFKSRQSPQFDQGVDMTNWMRRLSPRAQYVLVCDVGILALFVETVRVFLVVRDIPIPVWLWVL